MTSYAVQGLSQLLSSPSSAYLTEELTCQEQKTDNNGNLDYAKNGMVVLDKVQVRECKEKVYSIISENNGKFIFADLLIILGGPQYKKVLYHILSKLARQGKITRIRGISQKKIEFYYYDTKKIKKQPLSAAFAFAEL